MTVAAANALSSADQWLYRTVATGEVDVARPWNSGDTVPDKPGNYERMFSDGMFLHCWNGRFWFDVHSDKPHWRQRFAYPCWRVPAKKSGMTHANRKKPDLPGTPTPAEIRAAREAAGLDVAAAAALVWHTPEQWHAWEMGGRRCHPAVWYCFTHRLKET